MTRTIEHAPIKVGILHSLTGTMAMSERPVVDATLMAIAEINHAGGVLGRVIEPILRDGASEPGQFAQMAEELTEKEQVATVFGCWTSLSRKAVLSVFESQNILLWYPVQYEGLEQSPCVFYTGSCPNQQVEPALNWLLAQGWSHIYLVGSDYVFPRVANQIIKGQLKYHNGTVAGEDYVPLGATDFGAIAQRILAARPDAIFNTLNGDSNVAFYQQCQAAGIHAETLPIMAVSVAEAELQRIGAAATGHYACWSYFQSLDRASNHEFVARFRARYGRDRVTSDPIEAAYSQVYLWQQAVMRAQSFATDAVRQAAYNQSWEAPGGLIYCEANHHLRKECRIGQIQADGQFQIIQTSQGLLKPLPWLGVEEHDFASQKVVTEILGEVSQGVQYSWELEQKSHLLEQTMTQLRHEVEQRTQAEQALLLANAEILALNQSLQVDKLTLEERVRDRTQELETALQQLQQAQIQLIQTEKMSSLGQMVAGIAHEINNPINFIHGNTVHLNEYVKDLCKLLQMYQATFTPTPSIMAYEEDVDIEFILEDIPQLLDSINLGTKRVKEIVLAMRNYSRLDEAEVKEVDIHEGLESTLLILQHRIKQGITVIKDYDILPRIACNPAQLNQVFTNIMVNALDAMEEQPTVRKKLFITTRAIAPDAIQISFRDTGSGIPQEIQAKIFDPFFTTKSVGKGTGLGLGICYQIVRRHGGEITVNSTPQQGTEFVITLPIQLPTQEREQGAIDRTAEC